MQAALQFLPKQSSSQTLWFSGSTIATTIPLVQLLFWQRTRSKDFVDLPRPLKWHFIQHIGIQLPLQLEKSVQKRLRRASSETPREGGLSLCKRKSPLSWDLCQNWQLSRGFCLFYLPIFDIPATVKLPVNPVTSLRLSSLRTCHDLGSLSVLSWINIHTSSTLPQTDIKTNPCILYSWSILVLNWQFSCAVFTVWGLIGCGHWADVHRNLQT